MHVFTNGTDMVVAEDTDDAWAVWCAYLGGERREDYEGAWNWEQVEEGKLIKIGVEQNDGDVVVTEQTAREWVAADGRGFLCSSEW